MGRRAKPSEKQNRYVGKGGLKLEFAIEHFGVCIKCAIAADLGSHQGGFVDCLLQHGANKVYSIDTCYGTLAWSLRQNPKVAVCERTNALYWKSPEKLDFIIIDVGWTRQRHIIPAAVKNLKPGGALLSLLKPQYEMPFQRSSKGVLSETQAKEVLKNMMPWLNERFAKVSSAISPYRGSGGNVEMWLYLNDPQEFF